MNIQIFGMSKSFDTKKRGALVQGAAHRSINTSTLSARGLPGEYRSIKAAVGGFDALVNKGCRACETLYMAYITPQAAEEKLLEYRSFSTRPSSATGSRPPWGIIPRCGRRGSEAYSVKLCSTVTTA